MLVAVAKEAADMHAERAEILDGSTTFLFHSRPGVLSTRADHFAKVASGHLLMSKSWIILQRAPWGQLHPTRWRAAHSLMEGFASFTKGIMSLPV